MHNQFEQRKVENMKIGIEGQRLFRKNKHGMDFVTLELIHGLQQIDRRNEYVIFIQPDSDICIEEIANFKIQAFSSLAYPAWEQWALPRIAAKERVDILHCTSNTAPIWSSIPQILTLHDVIFLEKPQTTGSSKNWYQRFGNQYRKAIVPTVAQRCQMIITVSNYEREQILKTLPLPQEKIKVVYNGVSRRFKQIQNKRELVNIKEKYRLPKKFILFLGNTDPKKNLKGVLLAYSIFVENSETVIQLVIVDLKQKYLSEVLKELNLPGLQEHIVLPGYIPNRDLPAVYNLSDLFLYPSLRESFGLPVLEAMACGVPVIASNTSSMPEVAGDAALLVDPKDALLLANDIGAMLSHNNLRQRMIRKGFRQAERFSWQNTAEQVLQIYENTSKSRVTRMAA